MIATGLTFLLGALVALLLALLFVPILWRNAQRLARRDYAATMPATMGEIRAEVDRVRADAAMTVRRHEMLALKAREQLARERSNVGRLTAAQAKASFSADQHQSEANTLRAQLASSEERRHALEAEHDRLERENQELRETLAEAAAEMRMLEEEATSKAGDAITADARFTASSPDVPAGADREEPETARIAAATTALLAFAREQRRGRPADTHADAATAPSSLTQIGSTSSRDAVSATMPSGSADSALSLGSGERQLVEELRALAVAPRPSDRQERERQNERIRDRIADVAARIIQRSAQTDASDSPAATLYQARPYDGGDDAPSPAPVDLAERARRLGRPRSEQPTAAPSAGIDAGIARLSETAPETPPNEATSANGAKRKRGGARSRPRSPR